MKHIKLFESYLKGKNKPHSVVKPKPKQEQSKMRKNIIAYHSSNNRNIQVFKLDTDSGFNLFGPAMYFSSSYNNTGHFGKHTYKVELTMNNPLNLNRIVSNKKADDLLQQFARMLGEEISFTFSDDYDSVQFDEFFTEAFAVFSSDDVYKNIAQFIQSLGYDSFVHAADNFTNFISSSPTGKYDEKIFTYGVYNSSQIKIIDAPISDYDSDDELEDGTYW